MDVKWSFKTKKTEQNKKLLSDPFLIRTIQRDVLNKRYGHKNERVENVQGFERQGLADDDVKQIIDDLYTSWGFVETSVNQTERDCRAGIQVQRRLLLRGSGLLALCRYTT